MLNTFIYSDDSDWSCRLIQKKKLYGIYKNKIIISISGSVI